MKDQLGSEQLQDLYELLFHEYLYVKQAAIHAAYSERLVGQSRRQIFHREDVSARSVYLKQERAEC